jgi:hypothetical protein
MGKEGGLADIERAIADGEPMANTLRRCILLGGRSGSAALREWASQELNGYPGAELPAYRTLVAPLLIDGVQGMTKITGQQISPTVLPDFAQEHLSNDLPMPQGIGEIEAMIRSNPEAESVRLMPPLADDVVRLWNHERNDEFSQITRLYWDVSKVALEGLVERVRTKLTELVAEMRAGTPAGSDVPTEAIANQAVSVVVRGVGNRVNLVHGDGSSIDASQHGETPGFWTATRKVWGVLIGLATLIGTGLAVATWQQWI